MLTKEQLKAMRKAERLAITLSVSRVNYANGAFRDHYETTIRAIDTIHTKTDGHISVDLATITTDETVVERYDRVYDETGRHKQIQTGYAHLYKLSARVETFVRHLREGDCLTAVWKRDAESNQYMHEAGLHGDSFHVGVQHKGRATKDYYLLDVQCCPDNLARMLKAVA